MLKQMVWLAVLVGWCLVIHVPTLAGEKTIIIYLHPSQPSLTEITDEDLVARFMKENPTIKIMDEELPAENMAQKISIGIRAGTLPHVLRDYLGRTGAWAHQGVLKSLDETLTIEDREDFLPDVLSMYRLNGKLYGYPVMYWAQTYNANKTLLDKAGVSMPQGEWFLDEWMRIAEKVRVLPDEWATSFFASGRGGDYWMLQNFQMFGARLYENGNHSEITLNSDAGVEALEWMIGLVEKGFAPPGVAGRGGREYRQMFDAGKIAMECIGIRSALPHYNEMIFESGVTTEIQDVRVVLTPHTKGTSIPGLYSAPTGIVVFKHENQTEMRAAIKLAQFLSNPENCAAFAKADAQLPSRKSVNPHIGQRAYETAMKQIVEHGVADMGLTSPHYLEIRDLFAATNQAGFTGAKTPREALDDFAKAVKKLWME